MALGEPKKLTIVSDHQKGLTPVVQSTFPSIRHYFCYHHIAENIKSAFNDHGIVRKSWKGTQAYRPYEYEVYMNDIRSVDDCAFH